MPGTEPVNNGKILKCIQILLRISKWLIKSYISLVTIAAHIYMINYVCFFGPLLMCTKTKLLSVKTLRDTINRQTIKSTKINTHNNQLLLAGFLKKKKKPQGSWSTCPRVFFSSLETVKEKRLKVAWIYRSLIWLWY